MNNIFAWIKELFDTDAHSNNPYDYTILYELTGHTTWYELDTEFIEEMRKRKWRLRTFSPNKGYFWEKVKQ